MATSSTRRPAADRLAWRAEFLALAREIVRRDRQCDRFSVRYDTASVIADAMEMAFLQGLSRGEPGPPDEVPPRVVPWDSIPSASRRVFWTIGVFALGRGPAEARPAVLNLGPAGRFQSWFLSVGGETLRHGLFRPKAVEQLVRLGLLCSQTGNAEPELILTETGRATWWSALALTPGLFPQFARLVPQPR